MAERPHILWIITTQWRAHSCGHAGDSQARTPCLDALASRSIHYAQAVTPHPFGPFARAALLTGVPSPRNGVATYYDPLPTAARTVAHELRDRGYLTAWFGKWHLARRDPRAPLVGETHARMTVPPESRGGFDFWEGFEGGFQLNDPWLHGSRLPEPVRFRGYQSDVLCRRAAEWWREAVASSRDERQPVFCVVSLEPPHPPYAAAAAGIPPRAGADLELAPNVPRGGEVEARARRELAGYYAHIEATDRAIGALVDAVAAANPAIVVTSVHGDMHGAHGLFRKGWPHEESVRVPLLVHDPTLEPRRSEEPVSLLDLPTMTCAWVDGREWRCPRDHALISMPSVVPFADQCDRVWRGVRTPQTKVIFGNDDAPWLVFDLVSDPDETRNLAGSNAVHDVVAEARVRLKCT